MSDQSVLDIAHVTVPGYSHLGDLYDHALLAYALGYTRQDSLRRKILGPWEDVIGACHIIRFEDPGVVKLYTEALRERHVSSLLDYWGSPKYILVLTEAGAQKVCELAGTTRRRTSTPKKESPPPLEGVKPRPQYTIPDEHLHHAVQLACSRHASQEQWQVVWDHVVHREATETAHPVEADGFLSKLQAARTVSSSQGHDPRE